MDHAFVHSEKKGNVVEQPYNCWDGLVHGDDILSILDFPMESLEGGDDVDHEYGFFGDWDSTNYGPMPTASHVLQPIMPLMDELKQKQTNRPEDALCSFLFPPYKCNEFPAERKCDLKTQIPVSVIENNGSSLSDAGKIKRARTKRARPSGLSPWILKSPPFAKTCSARKNRESGKILSVAKKSIDMDSELQNGTVTKRCSHCQVTQTPQWRGGPMGPKTLCNACGVRYRLGRLLPEYRPAASPTFVSSLHSNSHKKVVEMRNGAQQGQVSRNEQPLMSPEMEFVPMSSCFFDFPPAEIN